MLVQLLTIDRGEPEVVCSRVLCVPPETGDPCLSVDAPAAFCPDGNEELSFIVRHAVPCEITVTVIDADGKTVRRLSSRQGSRPEMLTPAGSSFTWDGMDADGQRVPDGAYRIKVRVWVGEARYEYVSEPVLLLAMVG